MLLGVIGGAVLGGAVLFPDALGLRTITGFVHLSALRAPVTLVVLVLLPVLALLLRFPRPRRVLAGLLGGIAVLALASAGILVDRAVAGAARAESAAAGSGSAAKQPGDTLTVLTANVLIGNSGYDSVLVDAADAGADVIALQETSPAIAAQILHRTGLSADYAIAAVSVRSGVDTAATILLVRPALEPAEIDGTPLPFATAGVRTTVGDVYAVHTYAPIDLAPRQFNWWRSVSESAALCRAGEGTLVVGDFNAARDHHALHGHTDCADAGAELGMGVTGTWPAAVRGMAWPRPLGTVIDHQLFDPRTFGAQHGRVVDIPGSDHRGVLVEYRVGAMMEP